MCMCVYVHTVKKAYYKLSLCMCVYVCVDIHTVKKAYYKLSLPFHPQIAGNKFLAARKFQALGKVYDVLSDINKRRLYNREGMLRVFHQYYLLYLDGILLQTNIRF